jgi:hypothetical protein
MCTIIFAQVPSPSMHQQMTSPHYSGLSHGSPMPSPSPAATPVPYGSAVPSPQQPMMSPRPQMGHGHVHPQHGHYMQGGPPSVGHEDQSQQHFVGHQQMNVGQGMPQRPSGPMGPGQGMVPQQGPRMMGVRPDGVGVGQPQHMQYGQQGHQGTVSQAYFALHETLHEVQNF